MASLALPFISVAKHEFLIVCNTISRWLCVSNLQFRSASSAPQYSLVPYFCCCQATTRYHLRDIDIVIRTESCMKSLIALLFHANCLVILLRMRDLPNNCRKKYTTQRETCLTRYCTQCEIARKQRTAERTERLCDTKIELHDTKTSDIKCLDERTFTHTIINCS